MNVSLRQLDTRSPGFDAEFAALLHWSSGPTRGSSAASRPILSPCGRGGDAAVLEFTRRFDGLAADGCRGCEPSAADSAAPSMP